MTGPVPHYKVYHQRPGRYIESVESVCFCGGVLEEEGDREGCTPCVFHLRGRFECLLEKRCRGGGRAEEGLRGSAGVLQAAKTGVPGSVKE